MILDVYLEYIEGAVLLWTVKFILDKLVHLGHLSMYFYMASCESVIINQAQSQVWTGVYVTFNLTIVGIQGN